MKEIRKWLESAGPDYAQGVALYAAHGKSRVVLKSLQYGETEFTRQTLGRELAKLASAGEPPVHVVDTSSERVHEKAKSVHVLPQTVESSDELRRQRSTWYAERARLHAQLELVATDGERRVMGERILELSECISQSYEAPELAAAPTGGQPVLARLTDQGEIRRRLANLRPQASKLKKNPARAADLAQVLADIKLLETKLEKRDGGESKLHKGH